MRPEVLSHRKNGHGFRLPCSRSHVPSSWYDRDRTSFPGFTAPSILKKSMKGARRGRGGAGPARSWDNE
eukprot:1724413-Rhodomonas_salina.1